jgi:hypothetical protein
MFVSCIEREKLPGRIKDIICLHCLVCFVMFSHEHCTAAVIQGNKGPLYFIFQYLYFVAVVYMKEPSNDYQVYF